MITKEETGAAVQPDKNSNGGKCGSCALAGGCSTKIGNKPVLSNKRAKSVLSKTSGFAHKLLCSGPVLNMGDACVFSCRYCYVAGVAKKFRGVSEALKEAGDLKHHEAVVRREDALGLVRKHMQEKSFVERKDDSDYVVYTSSLVDCAGTEELAKETAEALKIMLAETKWQFRLLSKSHHLAKIPDLIPTEYHHRLIFGFSLGTLDDNEARVIEPGASLPSVRVKYLHKLQDRGLRTYAMFCPTMPVEDYQTFTRELAAAARIERCEHVWAEVFNPKGIDTSFMLDALHEAGLTENANRIEAVVTDKAAWEEYARATFLAWAEIVPMPKLRFLQYETKTHREWWQEQEACGAILLTLAGEREKEEKEAKKTLTVGTAEKLTALEKKDLADAEKIVQTYTKQPFKAGRALGVIKAGRLYKAEYKRFSEYCVGRWGMSEAQANRLIRAVEVFDVLESDPEKVTPIGVVSEAALRPLARLKTAEEIRMAYDVAKEAAGEGNAPTAKMVGEAAEEVTPKVSRTQRAKPVLTTSAIKAQRRLIVDDMVVLGEADAVFRVVECNAETGTVTLARVVADAPAAVGEPFETAEEEKLAKAS